MFRPPYGAYDSSVVATARSLGLATVLWNVDPSDYALPGTSAIEQRVLAQVRPGSIIISHDGGGPRGQTLAAYPRIIAALRARGYRIVTIPQLLGFPPVYVPCIKLCDGIGVDATRCPATRSSNGRLVARPRPGPARRAAMRGGRRVLRIRCCSQRTTTTRARSSVVNGSLRGAKEQRSFKPQAAGSIPAGRTAPPSRLSARLTFCAET